MKFLDTIPYPPLALVALVMGLAPFKPPHLLEKFQMLLMGQLQRPIDIFDLLFHLAPVALLLIKLGRDTILKKQNTE
ncbi:MAG: RND transporter [Thermodesulfobacteriota bacterium]